MKLNELDLRNKGFAPQPDGSWGKGVAVGGLATRQPELAKVSPLDSGIQKRQKGKGSVVILVTLIACRKRELDDDGNIASQKPLRDAVATSLGIDDGDKRIRFCYGQIETRGKCGTIVKVEKI